MKKEWFITEYEEKTYLHNKILLPYTFTGEKQDHDHCELCWAKFSPAPDDCHGGYYEPESKIPICTDCYSSLSSLFGWKVNTPNS